MSVRPIGHWSGLSTCSPIYLAVTGKRFKESGGSFACRVGRKLSPEGHHQDFLFIGDEHTQIHNPSPRPTFGSSSSNAFASPCRLARVPAPADEYGDHSDHRAACATSGHPRLPSCSDRAGHRAGLPGSRRNVVWAAMNLDVPIHDGRRIEVVCNGLPLWHGAQLAVDATLVSPVFRDGRPDPAQIPSLVALLRAQLPGASAGKPIPSSTAAGGAAWSSLGLRLAAAGMPKPPLSSACSRVPAPLPRRPQLLRQPGFSGGAASSL